MRLEHLGELRAQPQRGVQRRARILRDVGDGAAAQPPQLALAEMGEVAPVDHDGAAADRAAATDVAEQRHPDRRLARARLADQPEHLAGLDLERDLVDDVGAPAGQLDAQVAHLDRAVGS